MLLGTWGTRAPPRLGKLDEAGLFCSTLLGLPVCLGELLQQGSLLKASADKEVVVQRQPTPWTSCQPAHSLTHSLNAWLLGN